MKNRLLLMLMLLFTATSQSQWQADVRMTNDPGTSYLGENNAWGVAANANFVHIVWRDNRDGGNPEIYYKRSTDGGISWGTDTRLTNNPAWSVLASISVSGSVVHIVWRDDRDGNREIYYKRSTDDGVTWGSDIRLTNDPARSEYPSLAVSGQIIHVTWWDERNNPAEIYYKRSTDGGTTWEGDTRLSNHTANNVWTPSISVAGQVVHVVWQDERLGGGINRIGYTRSTDAGVTWSTETLLTTTGRVIGDCISASGQNVCIVWEDHLTYYSEIYCIRSTDGGISWGADIRLTNDPLISNTPSVCVSGQVIHVTWYDNRDGNYEIYYKKSTDVGNTWSPDIRLRNSSGNSELPNITASGSIVHAVWADFRDGNPEIYYKRDPTGNVTGITNINSEVPNSFSLSQNYPNPFNPETNFKFSLPNSTNVTIKIFDIMGREVDIIANNEFRSAGLYQVNYNASGLSSGVYFYNIRAGEYSETKKMVLTK